MTKGSRSEADAPAWRAALPLGGREQVEAVSRLPSFVKNGMVTAPKGGQSGAHQAKGPMTPRREAKVSLVKLGQGLHTANTEASSVVGSSRAFNEQLHVGIRSKTIPNMQPQEGAATGFLNLFPGVTEQPRSNSLVQNAKRKESLRRLQLSSSDPALRPTFQLPQLDRSKSLVWPTSTLPTPRGEGGHLRTPWLDQKLMSHHKTSGLPQLKFSLRRHHTSQTGWTSDWLSFHDQYTRAPGVLLKVTKTPTSLQMWQPTVDSVLKSEAMRNFHLRRKLDGNQGQGK